MQERWTGWGQSSLLLLLPLCQQETDSWNLALELALRSQMQGRKVLGNWSPRGLKRKGEVGEKSFTDGNILGHLQHQPKEGEVVVMLLSCRMDGCLPIPWPGEWMPTSAGHCAGVCQHLGTLISLVFPRSEGLCSRWRSKQAHLLSVNWSSEIQAVYKQHVPTYVSTNKDWNCAWSKWEKLPSRCWLCLKIRSLNSSCCVWL